MTRRSLSLCLLAILGALTAACREALVTPRNAEQPGVLASVSQPPSPAPFVAAGGKSTCALRPDATVACWGEATHAATTPTPGTFASIGAGFFHYCGIRSDQTLNCWGYNSDNRATPPGGTFRQISVGAEHNCALRTDDTAACWGFLGDGRGSPPPGTYKSIAVGQFHGCAIKPDDTLVCWGRNDYGQSTAPAGTFLSVTGGVVHSCAIRTDQTLLCFGDSPTPPAGAFVQVNAGSGGHTCAVRTDGTALCWGQNNQGQATAPAGMFRQASSGWQHSCGVRTDHAVVCWGLADNGATSVPAEFGNGIPVADNGGPYWGTRNQSISFDGAASSDGDGDALTYSWDFGDGSVGIGASPAHSYQEIGAYQVTLTVTDPQGASASATTTVTVELPSLLVAAGEKYSCALRADGTARCWGASPYGGSNVPPTEVFSQLVTGFTTTCGLKADGTIACYGSDGSGQNNSPPGLFAEVSIGQYHGCALARDGTLNCWGLNAGGALDLPAGAYAQVSAGWRNTCAIRPDGTLACAGINYPGQGGTVTAPAGQFIQVSTGEHHACGLRPDRSAICWGYNNYGEVGGTPAPVVTTFTAAGPFKEVRAGIYHTCALGTDGVATCWGYNGDGRSTPPPGSYVQIAAYSAHSCGVLQDQSIACWGTNTEGQTDVPTEFSGLPPTPVAQVGGPYSAPEGTRIPFSSAGSTGAGLSYAWSFGDGGTRTGANPQYKYADNGVYNVSLVVTDSIGRSSAPATTTATVSNVAPAGTFTIPITALEDKSLTISIKSIVEPGSADVLEFAFDCGDGAGYGAWSALKNAQCRPADNGQLTVRGKLRDDDGGETEYTGAISVTNDAPGMTFKAPATVKEGTAFLLQAVNPNVAPGDLATLQYAFDCGDGSGVGPWSSATTRSCATSDNGLRRVIGMVLDKDGARSGYLDSVQVTNVAPKVIIDNVLAGGPTDSVRTVDFHFTDPGVADGSPTDPSRWDGTVDCGQGSIIAMTWAPGDPNRATCNYPVPGTYTITVTIVDKDGGVGIDTIRVRIRP